MGFSFLMSVDQFIITFFGQVTQIPQTYAVFKRETSNNMYSPTAYYFSRLVISILTFALYPLICTTCTIWFLGLKVFTLKVFFGWFLDLWLISLVGNSLGLMIGCIVPDVMPAILYGNLITILFSMGAGLLANVNSGYFVRFLGWISP